MIEAALLIGTIIAGVTQAVKLLSPKIHGIVTVVVAIVVGALVAVVDTYIGVPDVTIAQGIMIAFGTIGTVTTVSKVG